MQVAVGTARLTVFLYKTKTSWLLCHRLFAICSVRLSMYICRVSLPDASLFTSACTTLTRARRAGKMSDYGLHSLAVPR